MLKNFLAKLSWVARVAVYMHRDCSSEVKGTMAISLPFPVLIEASSNCSLRAVFSEVILIENAELNCNSLPTCLASTQTTEWWDRAYPLVWNQWSLKKLTSKRLNVNRDFVKKTHPFTETIDVKLPKRTLLSAWASSPDYQTALEASLDCWKEPKQGHSRVMYWSLIDLLLVYFHDPLWSRNKVHWRGSWNNSWEYRDWFMLLGCRGCIRCPVLLLLRLWIPILPQWIGLGRGEIMKRILIGIIIGSILMWVWFQRCFMVDPHLQGQHQEIQCSE